jgi:hypothetical protein
MSQSAMKSSSLSEMVAEGVIKRSNQVFGIFALLSLGFAIYALAPLVMFSGISVLVYGAPFWIRLLFVTIASGYGIITAWRGLQSARSEINTSYELESKKEANTKHYILNAIGSYAWACAKFVGTVAFYGMAGFAVSNLLVALKGTAFFARHPGLFTLEFVGFGSVLYFGAKIVASLPGRILSYSSKAIALLSATFKTKSEEVKATTKVFGSINRNSIIFIVAQALIFGVSVYFFPGSWLIPLAASFMLSATLNSKFPVTNTKKSKAAKLETMILFYAVVFGGALLGTGLLAAAIWQQGLGLTTILLHGMSLKTAFFAAVSPGAFVLAIASWIAATSFVRNLENNVNEYNKNDEEGGNNSKYPNWLLLRNIIASAAKVFLFVLPISLIVMAVGASILSVLAMYAGPLALAASVCGLGAGVYLATKAVLPELTWLPSHKEIIVNDTKLIASDNVSESPKEVLHRFKGPEVLATKGPLYLITLPLDIFCRWTGLKSIEKLMPHEFDKSSSVNMGKVE